MPLDGPAALCATRVIDYFRFYLICVWLPVVWAQSSTSGELIVWRAAVVPFLLVSCHTIMDVFYGTLLLGPKSLAPVKREQIFKDCQNTRLIIDWTILTSQFALAVGVLAYLGAFAPMDVPDVYNWKDWMQPLNKAYMEFLILVILKDATSMGYFHRLMHDPRNKFFCKIHQLHHTYTTNLNMINKPCHVRVGYQFKNDFSRVKYPTWAAAVDPMDLFFQNTIGPFLFILLKRIIFGEWGQISLVGFLYSVSSEGTNHSLNPYSASYYFPPLDFLLKANIAHNLHHARTNSNFLSHPWHHLWEGYQKDVDRYNQIMKTQVNFSIQG